MMLYDETRHKFDPVLHDRIMASIKILDTYLDDKKLTKYTRPLLILKNQLSEFLLQLEDGKTEELEAHLNDFIGSARKGYQKFASSFRFKDLTKIYLQVYTTLTEVKEIEHEDFVSPKESLKREEAKWHSINRICFRGDDRSPSEIFKSGFTAQESTAEIIESPFQSSKSIVAFSSRFRAAAMFPLNEKTQTTWVYLVYARSGFDAHKHGYSALVQKGMTQDDAAGLFADELITDTIPSSDIIGAVKLNRYEYDKFIDKLPEFLRKNVTTESEQLIADFLKKRGKYIINEFVPNPNCTLPKETKELADWYIQKEMEANKTESSGQELPTPDTGYKRRPLPKKAANDDTYQPNHKPSKKRS